MLLYFTGSFSHRTIQRERWSQYVLQCQIHHREVSSAVFPQCSQSDDTLSQGIILSWLVALINNDCVCISLLIPVTFCCLLLRYGEHPAFFKYRTNNGKLLPLFYVYDSYLMNSEQWAKLLKHTESNSIRDTPYDAIFIALLVEEKHKRDILTAGFDGVYTYFATNGFSYGSTQRNWDSIKAFCEDNNLIFIPSVGPGYIDTSIRPWNFQNTRNRINGKYYETSLSAALQARPDFISITSFNEWHEGTQIEMAIPKTSQTVYLDYLPNKPAIYLEITRKWAAIFGGERRKWQEWSDQEP